MMLLSCLICAQACAAPPQQTMDGHVEAAEPEQTPDDRVAQAGATNAPAAACDVTYRQAARGDLSCKALFDFKDRCPGSLNATLATTALRLRCGDELFERDYKAMQQAFATAERPASCASMSEFMDRYTLDYRLFDTPEMEKATGARTRLCEQEARDKEIAVLETGLRGVLGKNDCTTFRNFEKQSGQKLSPNQSGRLDAAMKPRCELEAKANATLRACLDKNDTSGLFCDTGRETCFGAYRQVLREDTYFAAWRAESERRDKICTEFMAMRKCFLSDECGGEKCSLSTRLAVNSGPLINSIQVIEREASRQCRMRQDRERVAREEAERERRVREEELRRELRESRTVEFGVCNFSAQSKVDVAVSYYDYDAGNWIIEGWWTIDQGRCAHLGDRFRRGKIYYYAANPGETRVWSGDFSLCITMSRFRVVNTGLTCNADRLRQFRTLDIDTREYTLRLT
jgi:uncharacterized membrane protein